MNAETILRVIGLLFVAAIVGLVVSVIGRIRQWRARRRILGGDGR